MNRTILLLLLLTSALASTALLFKDSYASGLCSANASLQEYDLSCHAFYESVGDPLFYGMGALSIIFLLLLLVPRAYRVWQRFAVWYLPFAISLFLFYRDPGSGDLFSPYPEQVYRWVAGIFVCLSVLVIAVSAKFGKANDTSPLIRNTFLRILWVLYVAYLVYSVIIHYY